MRNPLAKRFVFRWIFLLLLFGKYETMKFLQPVLFILVLSFGFNRIEAQTFSGGVQAGLAVSQIYGDLRGGYDKANAMLGIFIERTYKQQMSWGFDMYYTGKGSVSVIKYSNGASFQEFKNSLHYLEFPFFIKYEANPKLKIGGGLGLAYFLSGRFTSGGSQLYDNYYQMRKLDIAPMWIVEYKLGEKTAVNVRFFYSSFSVADNINWHNNALTFALRYKLK